MMTISQPHAAASLESVVVLDSSHSTKWLLWCLLLACVCPWAPAAVYAQDATNQAPKAPAGTAAPKLDDWAELGLGVLAPASIPERRTGGVDVGLGGGVLWGRLRLGAELRYTFAGGFDTDKPSYRADFGPYVGVELLQRKDWTIVLGSRSLFSRAGTYRREEVDPGYWVCRHHNCEKEGTTYRKIPFVAFYGLTATLDLTLRLFRDLFVRASYLRTRWMWDHDLAAPNHQQWWHFTAGFAVH